MLRAALYNGVMIENPNILIVDDERSIAELVAETLQGAGMLTQVCVHAGEALPMVREGSFDLIILDVMMPGVDGFELCARMRAESFVPIIFLSAKDEEADKVLGLTCGGDDYITKRFCRANLSPALNHALGAAPMPATLRYSVYFAVAVSSLIRRPMWCLFMESGFRLRQRSSICLRCFCEHLGGRLPPKTSMKRFGKICICPQAPIPLWCIFAICDQSSRRSTPSRCLSRPSGVLATRSRPSLGRDVWGDA